MTNPTPWIVETDVDTSQIVDDLGAVVASGTPADQAAFEEIALANSLADVPVVHPPIGTWFPYGGLVAPDGYIFADGGEYSRVTYQYLFAVYGERFGAGDGVETFNVPDMRDRVPKGKGAATDVGDTGGSTTLSHSGTAVDAHAAHTHSVTSNVAVGNHTVTQPSAHSHTTATDEVMAGSDVFALTDVGNHSHTGTAVSAHSVTNNAVTSGNPSASLTHSVTQPSDHASVEPPNLVCNYIIRCW